MDELKQDAYRVDAEGTEPGIIIVDQRLGLVIWDVQAFRMVPVIARTYEKAPLSRKDSLTFTLEHDDAIFIFLLTNAIKLLVPLTC